MQGEDSCLHIKEKGLRRNHPVNSLLLESQPPELGETTVLLAKPPSLQCLIILAKQINMWGNSCSVVSDSLQLHGLYSQWNSPGQHTGVSSLSLLQGSFPTQELNPGLALHQGCFPGDLATQTWRVHTYHDLVAKFMFSCSWMKNPVLRDRYCVKGKILFRGSRQSWGEGGLVSQRTDFPQSTRGRNF